MTQLGDLFAATETVGDDDRRGRGGLDRGQQAVAGDGLRELKLAGFKAEGAGHAAAAGLDRFDRSAGLAEQGDFIGRTAENGFVVTVAVDQNLYSG
jgi:hypothetical protein